jgi:hypothetical protein
MSRQGLRVPGGTSSGAAGQGLFIGGVPGTLIGLVPATANLTAYKTAALSGSIPGQGTLTGALTANIPTRALVGNIPGHATFTANLTSGATSTNRVLLADGTSFLLQTDGTSKVLEASGASTANLLLLADGVSHLLFTDGASRLQLAA